ncbi:MAG: imidazoleglycerol-phosphate dehydratase HisB [Candidatus Bathyarchaeia archaeon]
MRSVRKAIVERKTLETSVKVELSLEGQGDAQVSTGIAFLDHMLGALAKHSLFDLKVRAEGLRGPDDHHIVEDVAITLGKALSQCLGKKEGIRRFGAAVVPMDEALAEVALDLSGRGHLTFQGSFVHGRIGDMASDMIPHFLESLAFNGGLTIHVARLYGRIDHHKAEALFKALGLALAEAVLVEPRLKGGVPSQKGVIE